MPVHSYKHYLTSLYSRSKPSLSQKALLTFFALALVISGSVSAFYYYRFQKEPSAREKGQYLEVASGGFFSTKQSLNEMLETFKVASAKIEAVDTTKEATPSAYGFFITLEDINKTLSKIEVTSENISFQKEILMHKSTPSIYSDLNIGLINYYLQGEQLMEELHSDHQFAKEILSALGTNFYLPTLTNEFLWRSQNEEEIIKFYEDGKTSADSTLENLSRLTIPPKFANYYDNHIQYLTEFIITSDKIISLLKEQDETNPDSATQIEKAYQVLTVAKKTNEILFEKLLQGKLKIVDLEENVAKFAPVTIGENAIEIKLADLSESQTKPSKWQLMVNARSFLRNIIFKIR